MFKWGIDWLRLFLGFNATAVDAGQFFKGFGRKTLVHELQLLLKNNLGYTESDKNNRRNFKSTGEGQSHLNIAR